MVESKGNVLFSTHAESKTELIGDLTGTGFLFAHINGFYKLQPDLKTFSLL